MRTICWGGQQARVSTFARQRQKYLGRSTKLKSSTNLKLSRILTTLDKLLQPILHLSPSQQSKVFHRYLIHHPLNLCYKNKLYVQYLLFGHSLRMSISDVLEYLATIGTLYPSLSFIFTIAGACWIGNAIVTQYLMEKQIRHTLSRIIFLITFSCSLSLLSMYLFQIMRFKINHMYWYFVLITLLAMCEIVIPLCLIFRLPFVDYRVTQLKIPILGFFVSGIYLYFFNVKVNKTWEQLGTPELQLKIFIELIIEYGVYLMAVMSAYGAIWFPYTLYNLINQKQRHKILHAKKKMENEIHENIQQIKIHKYKLLQIKERKEKVRMSIEADKMKANDSTIIKMFNFIKGSKVNEQEKELSRLDQENQEHINALQTLKNVHEESFLNYRDIIEEQRRHTVSQTLYGKIFHKSSYFLAAYSLTRIFLTIYNTIRGRKISADPITRLVNIVQEDLHLSVGPTFQEITQYISFILMGYIMITSVRAFSINFKSFIDYILRRKRLNMLDSATQIYLFSLVYGIYFLAAVILQQSSLPRAYVTTFEHITGKINLLKHFVLFDWIFMSMCGFSLCLLYFTERQRREKLYHIIQNRNIIDLTKSKD